MWQPDPLEATVEALGHPGLAPGLLLLDEALPATALVPVLAQGLGEGEQHDPDRSDAPSPATSVPRLRGPGHHLGGASERHPLGWESQRNWRPHSALYVEYA